MSATCYIIYIERNIILQQVCHTHYFGSGEAIKLSQHSHYCQHDHLGQQAGNAFDVQACYQNATAKKDVV